MILIFHCSEVLLSTLASRHCTRVTSEVYYVITYKYDFYYDGCCYWKTDCFYSSASSYCEVVSCVVSLKVAFMASWPVMPLRFLPIISQHIAPGTTIISVGPLGGIQQARNTTIPASYR